MKKMILSLFAVTLLTGTSYIGAYLSDLQPNSSFEQIDQSSNAVTTKNVQVFYSRDDGIGR
ncbi:MAG TPA: hypothetical protein VF149_07510 [Bacillales bacterium]